MSRKQQNKTGASVQPDIGIITALPEELAAMKLVLVDEIQPGGGKYFRSELQGPGNTMHQLVLTSLPEMGNNQAAVAATQLLNDFPSIKYLIMCGIAAGIPHSEPEKNPRLGDIFISTEVVQCDRGKLKDGKFESRPPPRPAGHNLISACWRPPVSRTQPGALRKSSSVSGAFAIMRILEKMISGTIMLH